MKIDSQSWRPSLEEQARCPYLGAHVADGKLFVQSGIGCPFKGGPCPSAMMGRCPDIDHCAVEGLDDATIVVAPGISSAVVLGEFRKEVAGR